MLYKIFVFLFTGQQERESGRNYKRHLVVRDEGFEPQGNGEMSKDGKGYSKVTSLRS